MTPAERARKCAEEIATRRVITQGWWTDTELVAIIQRHIEEAVEQEREACALLVGPRDFLNLGMAKRIRACGMEEKREQLKAPILGRNFRS